MKLNNIVLGISYIAACRHSVTEFHSVRGQMQTFELCCSGSFYLLDALHDGCQWCWSHSYTSVCSQCQFDVK